MIFFQLPLKSLWHTTGPISSNKNNELGTWAVEGELAEFYSAFIKVQKEIIVGEYWEEDCPGNHIEFSRQFTMEITLECKHDRFAHGLKGSVVGG